MEAPSGSVPARATVGTQVAGGTGSTSRPTAERSGIILASKTRTISLELRLILATWTFAMPPVLGTFGGTMRLVASTRPVMAASPGGSSSDRRQDRLL